MGVPPTSAPQSAPQDNSAQQGQGGPGPAEQSITMIKNGFQQLGKMIQSAGQNVDPTDIKLFQAAVQATDSLIQSLTSPAEEKAPPQGPPSGRPGKGSGPMPMNANPNARQMQ